MITTISLCDNHFLVVIIQSEYHIRANVWQGVFRQISYQKPLASKRLVNSCSFAFFIVHTISSLVINAPHTYITHMNSNEAG